MTYTTLVDCEVLARHLANGWRVFDCRFVLSDAGAGERSYHDGHIPGAEYLHLDHDLAAPVTAVSGRHPLPDPTVLAATLASAGVHKTTQVIAYDASSGEFAARLWWLLRWLGHAQVAVLDGGWRQWCQEGRQVSRESPRMVKPGNFHAQPDDGFWLSSAAVAERLRRGNLCLLDARAASRFRGEQETIDPVAGHVPGAVNLPYAGNVLVDGRFQSAEALRARFVAALNGADPADTACMCGSGVTACHNLLAMELAGLRGAKLYAGSWSEWIRDPSRPVATRDG
ncbi:MAG: sulfurtransferase [Gammaproteobacteria bacterium]|nr:sulfurtransferase [Gammaproteobacteria bacterium]MBU6509617.1 sulfurtransferase [Gammaproteobacteria bacterium]MDE1983727.1 sulfurtransferase [Gammaproteobacteria bacterium]MDE2108478.1 sulfurtransferase [Gammaproteobacteria bacterium]